MPTCWVTSHHLVRRVVSNNICDTCKWKMAGFSQSTGYEASGRLGWMKVVNQKQSKATTATQACWKSKPSLIISTRIWRSRKIFWCSFLTFLANQQNNKPHFNQTKMEIPRIKLTISRVTPFHWNALMSQIWQVTGARNTPRWVVVLKHGRIRWRINHHDPLIRFVKWF